MTVSIEWIILTAITVILIGTIFSLLILRRKASVTRTVLAPISSGFIPVEGYPIPLLQSFAGIKWLAPLSFGGNNLNPLLVFHTGHLEYRAIFKRKASYQDIAFIRSFHSPYYNKLRLAFSHRIVYFTAVFGNEQTLQTVLYLLAEKGITPDEKSRL